MPKAVQTIAETASLSHLPNSKPIKLDSNTKNTLNPNFTTQHPKIIKITRNSAQVNQSETKIHQESNGTYKNRLNRHTRVSSRGARRTIEKLERAFENRGKRKIVIDTTGLDVAVDGGETAGDGGRGGPAGGEAAVRYKRWSH